jgi:NAD(P)-dependent dehydrogenase (short-subunit alcohol dehydrogenase family)
VCCHLQEDLQPHTEAEWQANNQTLVYPSELASVLIDARNPEEELPNHERFVPARRFGTDEEMSGAILYLASRAGAYTNGAVFTTDGGRLSAIPSTY